MNKKILITAAFLGFTAIVLGAFGAHGLKELVSPEQIATFETGIRFQMYHALFLLFLGISKDLFTSKTNNIIFSLVTLGVVLFSGSIYGLATNELTAFDFKKIALITPLGGTLLILAWGWLLVSLIKQKKPHKK
ncbi:MAG: DUF423 domain-containing protein [Bacteroidetes bacterium]|nr:DUF423 domain-containing protein [Bacteroidota bacterium]